MQFKDVEILSPQKEMSILPNTASPIPNIFEYQDYRIYLRDWFQWKKSVSSFFSGAVFAKKAGINSHTLLGMVMRGQRNLGYDAIRSFSKALNLKGKEKIFFEKLVLMNQCKNSEQKAEYFGELIAISGKSGRKVSQALHLIKDYDRYLSVWYVSAIREMVNVDGFQPDIEWMYSRLKKRVQKKEIEMAWQTLLELGLVRFNTIQGKHEVSEPNIDFDSHKTDFTIRNFHKKYLDLSKDFLDQEPLDQRDLSTLVFSVTEEKLSELKELIKELRMKLNAEDISEKDKKYVVAFNMQLLILTNKDK